MDSRQHRLDWPTPGKRQRGGIAEPHDEIRSPAGKSNEGREVRPETRDLNGLIDEGVLQAKGRRLQCETLRGAAHLNPVLRVGRSRYEDRKACG